jgi:hypothetical protein
VQASIRTDYQIQTGWITIRTRKTTKSGDNGANYGIKSKAITRDCSDKIINWVRYEV